MPIVIEPVKPFVQPPHRGKIVAAGGTREPLDFSKVHLHFDNGQMSHLIVHQDLLRSNVMFEIHNSMSRDGTHEVENSRMTCYELSRAERLELAVYLLSTI